MTTVQRHGLVVESNDLATSLILIAINETDDVAHRNFVAP
jgi:hypothetical protein